MQRKNEIVVRIKSGNPNHHLYLNNQSTWWMHFTRHNADYTKVRVRLPLRTKDVVIARKRRDELVVRLTEDDGDDSGQGWCSSMPLAA